MTKKEFYSKMRDLFVKHFGEDFKEHRLEIKKRLSAGEAPEINELYQHAVYELNLFGGCHQSVGYTWYQGFGYRWPRVSRYNLWDYDRLSRLFKHL